MNTEPYVQRVLDSLKQVKRSGASWTARCPAHDDQNPSLSVSLGTEGRILVKCHGPGCSFEDIAKALGLEEQDFFPPREPAPVVYVGKKELVATYPYVDEQGHPLYDVKRWSDKSFSQHKPGGPGGIQGIRRVLYHLDLIQGKKTVYIAEGEKDVDNLWVVGLPATCNSGGAGKWTEEHTKQLVNARAQRVVILPDQDQIGSLHGETVARSCHAAGLAVKVVNLPNLPEKGDVSDWLEVGHMKEDLGILVKESAQYVPKADTEPTVEDHENDLDVVNMEDVVAKPVDWLWDQHIARGMLTIIGGVPGEGKSFVTDDLGARITRGLPWPDGAPAGPVGTVLYLAAEDNLEYIMRPRLDALGADVTKVKVIRGTKVKGKRRMFSLAEDLQKLSEWAKRTNAQLIVIDPVNAYLGGKIDNYNDPEVREVLTPLALLSEELNIAVVCVMHLKKGAETTLIYKIGGSVAFSALVRAIFYVCPSKEDANRKLLTNPKMSMWRKAPTLAFRITEQLTLAWEEKPDPTTPEEAMAEPSSRPTKRGHAVEWLEAYLKGGPIPAKDGLAAALEAGISERTIERAKTELGVKTNPVRGDDDRRITGWVWEMPPF